MAEVDIESLYVRYGAMVRRRCLALLKNPEHAEDAMQDVFVRLMVHGKSLDDRGLSSLLYRVATQVSLNRLRTQRRHPEDASDDLLLRIAHAEDLENQSAVSQLLARVLGKELESTRTLATLHLVDGLTLEEVACEVGMSVSGVRKRLRGLRERLELVSQEASEHG